MADVGDGEEPPSDEDLLRRMFFPELDAETIDRTYQECHRDVSLTMKALAELLKQGPPGSQQESDSNAYGREVPPDADYDDGGADEGGEGGEPSTSFDAVGAPWDVASLTAGLVTVGDLAAEGLTTLAASFSSWVTDIASAFDTGWANDPDDPITSPTGSARLSRPSPLEPHGSSGLDGAPERSQRSRRLQVSTSSPRVTPAEDTQERSPSRTPPPAFDDDSEGDEKKDS